MLAKRLEKQIWRVQKKTYSTASLPKSRRMLHNFAISRDMPASFEKALTKHNESGDYFSIDKARKQHDEYIRSLRTVIPTLCLLPLEENPDCIFVEDTVVAIGNKAVVTQPGHPSRRGEVDSVQEALRSLGMEVTRMIDQDADAFCDGGDVLFTGRHVFVGISERTNEAAVKVLSAAFPEYPVLPVPPIVQGTSALHLKSVVTHVNSSTLLAPSTLEGCDSLLEAMKVDELGYKVYRLPDVLACNAVTINDHTLLVQDTKCAESRSVLIQVSNDLQLKLIWVDTSELAKKDAALTCCSVLLSLNGG